MKSYNLGNYIFKTKKALELFSKDILKKAKQRLGEKIKDIEIHLFLCDLVKRNANFPNIKSEEIDYFYANKNGIDGYSSTCLWFAKKDGSKHSFGIGSCITNNIYKRNLSSLRLYIEDQIAEYKQKTIGDRKTFTSELTYIVHDVKNLCIDHKVSFSKIVKMFCKNEGIDIKKVELSKVLPAGQYKPIPKDEYKEAIERFKIYHSVHKLQAISKAEHYRKHHDKAWLFYEHK
uniref:Uncharacterized protein n=3 Tax=viral metagenome TaxID=1070528 RepID=A0A6H1ZN85_9ZZZZ